MTFCENPLNQANYAPCWKDIHTRETVEVLCCNYGVVSFNQKLFFTTEARRHRENLLLLKAYSPQVQRTRRLLQVFVGATSVANCSSSRLKSLQTINKPLRLRCNTPFKLHESHVGWASPTGIIGHRIIMVGKAHPTHCAKHLREHVQACDQQTHKEKSFSVTLW